MIHLKLSSGNAKTGPIPVTTSSNKTCPNTCPFMGQGCYAKSGPLAIHWNNVTKQALKSNLFTIDELCNQIASFPRNQLWRHNQAGDLDGDNLKINSENLIAIARANKGKRGFTYTHKPVLGNSEVEENNRDAIKKANQLGFTINLSGDNLDHADRLADLKIGPVVAVVSSDTKANMIKTPKGRKVLICPAQQEGKKITCNTCGICQIKDRKFIVGFKAHGTLKKKIDKILAQV